MSVTPLCCKIGCDEPARMEIVHFTRDPYDFTQACLEHVGELLGSAHPEAVWGQYVIHIQPLKSDG